MRNAAYLLLDLGAIASAFGVGFWKQQRWLRQWKPTVLAITLVGALFVVWDVMAAAAGHWSFNPSFTLGAAVAGLPLEELLFFVAIPLVALSAWELCNAQPAAPSRGFAAAQGGVLGASMALVLMNPHGYSLLAGLAAGVTAIWWLRQPYGPRNWLVFQGVALVLFIGGNAFLTALPIVSYDAAHFSNVRLGTIPVEDFFYNYALVGITVLMRRLADRAV